jgi:DNA-binding GntR family transcriptional regulator
MKPARKAISMGAPRAVAAGMSEAEAARVAGVDRMTVRRALGKR